MKKFDFDKCKRNPKVKAWLANNQHFPITEEEYIINIRPLTTDDKGKSSMKNDYRKLKEVFGFFPKEELDMKKEKNPHAVAMAHQRARSMTAKRRKEIASIAGQASARAQKLKKSIIPVPVDTHEDR